MTKIYNYDIFLLFRSSFTELINLSNVILSLSWRELYKALKGKLSFKMFNYSNGLDFLWQFYALGRAVHCTVTVHCTVPICWMFLYNILIHSCLEVLYIIHYIIEHIIIIIISAHHSSWSMIWSVVPTGRPVSVCGRLSPG